MRADMAYLNCLSDEGVSSHVPSYMRVYAPI